MVVFYYIIEILCKSDAIDGLRCAILLIITHLTKFSDYRINPNLDVSPPLSTTTAVCVYNWACDNIDWSNNSETAAIPVPIHDSSGGEIKAGETCRKNAAETDQSHQIIEQSE